MTALSSVSSLTPSSLPLAVSSTEGVKPRAAFDLEGFSITSLPQFLAKTVFLAYARFALPPQDKPRKYLILNASRGGLGDFAIAAQNIETIAKIDRDAEFHWSVDKSESHIKSFLDRLLTKGIRVKAFEYLREETGFSPGEKIDGVIYCPLGGLRPSDTPYFQRKFSLSSDIKMRFVREIGDFPDRNWPIIKH